MTTNLPARGTLYALDRPHSAMFPPRPAVVALDGLWLLTEARRRLKLVPASEPRGRGTLTLPSVLLLHFDLSDDDFLGEPAADALVVIASAFNLDVLFSGYAEELRPYDPRKTGGDGRRPAWVLRGLASREVIAEMIPVGPGLMAWRAAVDTFQAERAVRVERRREDAAREAVATAVAVRVTDFAHAHGMPASSAYRTNGSDVRVEPDVLTYLLDHFRPTH